MTYIRRFSVSDGNAVFPAFPSYKEFKNFPSFTEVIFTVFSVFHIRKTHPFLILNSSSNSRIRSRAQRVVTSTPEDRFSEVYRETVRPVEEALRTLGEKRAPERGRAIRSIFEPQMEDGQRHTIKRFLPSNG